MFVKLHSFSISEADLIERRSAELPASIKPPPVTVRVIDGLDRHEAVRLIRRLADEIETAP